MKRSPREKAILYAKGAAMGAADVVPGVSGGTIAFITGIYEELLGTIRSVDAEALRLLLKFNFKGFWKHINGSFLLLLFAGIITSVVSLARVLVYLLENFPILVWSFFFGLIVASAWLVSRQVGRWTVAAGLAVVIGLVVAFLITEATPAETPEALWFVLLSGSLAICAMILPGISGSFILVLLGKYKYILGSLEAFRLEVIAVFIVGCVVGLLSFARLLSWLFKRYHDLTVAVLTGFMIGSLNKVWPWKETLSTYLDRHGIEKPLRERNVLPSVFEEVTGQESYLGYALLLAGVGFLAVYLLERLSDLGAPATAENA